MRPSHARRSPASPIGDSLSTYLAEISRYPLLSRDDEVALATRASGGDALATEQLVCANLRFVVSVAKKYRDQGVSMPDLINEGNIGLMRAAEKFDAGKGVKFITYAVWWIRQAMISALASQSSAVRVPPSRAGAARRLRRSAATLRQELGRDPTRLEWATAAGVSEVEIDFSVSLASSHVSLDAPLGATQDFSLMDQLVDDSGDASDDDIEASAPTEWVRASLGALREREARVLRMHYGLDGNEPMTLEEVGRSMGITRERVRQLRDRALSRMRKLPTAQQVAPRRRAAANGTGSGSSAHWQVLSR